MIRKKLKFDYTLFMSEIDGKEMLGVSNTK